MGKLEILTSFIFLCLGIIPQFPALVYENDPKELLNWCIDARSHKSHPGPTDGLHQQCQPWEKRSCCTKTTTVAAHITKMYNFNWDHCNHVKPLSPACRRHFVQDLCFYECSPNTGPWVMKVNGMKMRRERFVDMPLCASECDKWFEDCSDDMTCTNNWVRNFDWSTGSNKCYKGTTCTSYRSVFKTAENFCEQIWDYSWKYTSDTEPCMKIWFNGTNGNPNDAVAARKLEWIIKTHKLGNYELTSNGNDKFLNGGILMTSLLVFFFRNFLKC